MGIVDDDIERVRASVNIVDVVTPVVQLRRQGASWMGRCPFHHENTPSFSVRESVGRYHCFGCGASGDAIEFVRRTEHVDFVTAVEKLAAKAGIALRYTDPGAAQDRTRRAVLYDTVAKACEWYHQRLLDGPDAGPARAYLRSRGIDGRTARTFRLGWAPDAWDELARALAVPADVLRDTGLGFLNKAGRQQDFFRARLLFPIFDEQGNPVAFGGRVLPGADGPKYKNSTETKIYVKSRTLYGLCWAKADAVAADELVVCEGYTDVIGFHLAGLTRAVATCGTALTEDHVKVMRRFARRIVLAFDADAAGQGAAERVYAWEREYDLEVKVAALPAGSDPADLARTDPPALLAAVRDARPFLEFRLRRVLPDTATFATAESRVRAAEQALAMIGEHPSELLRREYAGWVATRTGLPVEDVVAAAVTPRRHVPLRTAAPVRRHRAPVDSCERVALRLLIHDWDSVAPWVVPQLFADPVAAESFDALAAAEGDLHAAIARTDGPARQLLEQLAVEDPPGDPFTEICHLLRAGAQRRISVLRPRDDLDATRELVELKRLVVALDDPDARQDAAGQLLGWLGGVEGGP